MSGEAAEAYISPHFTLQLPSLMDVAPPQWNYEQPMTEDM